ncbi:hypothetical protein C9382_26285 [Pseudomonas aylmerensis]|jgi:hypothetical protein|uniref:Uncharacterized protein n=1 Tax=Pseudomonas aylmerensis TaxID=1869229 RepID=A0A2T4FMD9_9PSED|nr:hypothetical protein [Pseudomonas aylmerensis]OCW25487.1 hypothetical protein BBG20_16270 [Pseudomonas aylmerensis]PTC24560.1 hypothetical protein C9382_26285 [Pseudomonas aylmerensis]
MTVIAFFEDVRIAIADVLITKSLGREAARTPTGGTTEDFARHGLQVTRLVRKMVTAEGPVGRIECLVAGTVSHIDAFAQVLQAVLNNSLPLPDELRETVRRAGVFGCFQVATQIADNSGFSEYEVIGVAGANMCFQTVDATRVEEVLPYFGKVYIAGSGSFDLLHWLRLRGETFARVFAEHPEDTKRFHIAHMVPLMLMQEDLGEQRTLQAGVGGYYEAFQILPGKLEPFDECLTVFVDLLGRKRDATVQVRHVLYHCYRGSTLHVLSLNTPVKVSAVAPVKVPLDDFGYHEIPPLQGSSVSPSWTRHMVAAKLRGARTIRTVIRKKVGGKWVDKRLLNNGAVPVVLTVSLAGDNLVLAVDVQSYEQHFTRFPSDHDTVLKV